MKTLQITEQGIREAALEIYDDMANPDSAGMSVDQMAACIASHCKVETERCCIAFHPYPESPSVQVGCALDKGHEGKHAIQIASSNAQNLPKAADVRSESSQGEQK